MKTKAAKLIPVDNDQCQCEKPSGNTFMSFGGVPGRVRCTNKPTVIITERVANDRDGLCGSMSLCSECLAVFKRGNDTTNYKLRPAL